MEKLITLVLMTVVFTGCVSSHTFRDSNTYMDTIVNNYLKTDVSRDRLDPASLPNFNTTFKDHGLTVSSNYSRGVLNGLSTVRRAGNCGRPTPFFGNSTVNCSLTFDHLNVLYDVKMRYGRNPVVSATASGTITGTNITVEVTAALSRNVPSIRQYVVRTLGRFSPSYSGLGPMNHFRRMLTAAFTSNTSAGVAALLYDQFRNEVVKDVGKVVLPVP